MRNKLRQCWLIEDHLIPYGIAWIKQKQLVNARLSNSELPDILWLLEHPSVYTLGTGSSLEFLKFDPRNHLEEIYRVERGGEVTYHCPGQIVGYAILNLRYHKPDLHWYLRQLEEVIIKLLQKYGLVGERIPGLTGVWLQGVKVAAIGIKVKKWITMHGFALNVTADLSGFQKIVPCGISDKPVGSLQQFLPFISLSQVRRDLSLTFAEVFQLEIVEKVKIKEIEVDQ